MIANRYVISPKYVNPMASEFLQIQSDDRIAVSPDASVGLMGEAIAAQWVRAQQWNLLHHRWHCRWGELDWVAWDPSSFSSPHIVFIEVKTRRSRNWDGNGVMALTRQKQQKLWQTAELFLAAFPQFASVPCRFDLILMQHRRSPIGKPKPVPPQRSLHTSESDESPSSAPSGTDRSTPTSPSIPDAVLIVPPLPPTTAASPWIPLGTYQFRVDQHIKHAFEAS